MPDPIVTPAPVANPFDTKPNNDAAAAALLREQSLAPVADPLSVSALDDLAAEKSKENKEKEAAAPVPEIKPVVEDPAAKAAAEAEAKAKEERAAALKQADELFKDAPQLAPNASPKSSEAFAAIKIKAAQDISRLQSELDAAKKAAEEAKQSATNPGPEQLEKEKELEELRQWRSKMDVDFDPRFKAFDANIAKANEFIYAQLRKSSVVTEETIKQIEKYGGPAKCNLTELFNAMKDPTLQRVIEGQISDVLKTQFEKEQAIKNAKENVNQYLAERQKTFQESTIAHQQATAVELNKFVNSLDWFKEKTVDAKATETEKAAAAEHNKFLEQVRPEIQNALVDDSPKMRATLITGVVQLFNLQRVHKALTAEFEALKKSHSDLQARWEKVKNSGRARLAESGAPSSGVPPAKPANIFTMRADEALDAAAKQVMEEKARASGGAA